MSTAAITGKDTLVLKGRVFLDMADGDNSQLTFPNDLVAVKTGKNNNSIYSKNQTGLNGEMTLRVIRGSSDDKFLQNELAQVERDMPSYELINGSFIKKIGDGLGNITNDTYDLSGGIIKKQVEAKENSEGDTEQAISIYTLVFAVAKRALG